MFIGDFLMWRNNASLTFLIVVPILFAIGLGYVLKVSFATPVEMANDYQMGYKQVDKNYDDIVKQSRLFDSKYDANITTPEKMIFQANKASLIIVDKHGNSVKDANVTALVTRPDTSKLDKKLTIFAHQDGKYTSQPFDVEKEGRWKINFKIQIGDAVKFIDFEGFARK
jgi:FixH